MFDDFDGPAGRLPDPAVWAPWLGADADYTSAHTDYPRNACLDGNGHLAITAIRETVKDPRLGGRSVRYTTAMLTTQGRVERQYGTWSARIYLPPGRGHHPTFYLWGATYDPKTNPWPNCGEVDIIELQDTLQGSSIHGPGYDWLHGTQISVAAPLDVRGGWHTYTCRHEPDKLTIQIDGGLPVAVLTPAVLPKGKTWVFNQPLFAVLDLSVGTGTNKPDGQPFPITMLVDWIRHEPLTQRGALMALSDDEQRELFENVKEIRAQLGPSLPGWPSLGKNTAGQELTWRDAFGVLKADVAAVRKKLLSP